MTTTFAGWCGFGCGREGVDGSWTGVDQDVNGCHPRRIFICGLDSFGLPKVGVNDEWGWNVVRQKFPTSLSWIGCNMGGHLQISPPLEAKAGTLGLFMARTPSCVFVHFLHLKAERLPFLCLLFAVCLVPLLFLTRRGRGWGPWCLTDNDGPSRWSVCCHCKCGGNKPAFNGVGTGGRVYDAVNYAVSCELCAGGCVACNDK